MSAPSPDPVPGEVLDLGDLEVPATDRSGRPVRIVLLTRDGCHLCDAAATTIATVAERRSLGWAAVDLDASQRLRRRFAELIPVVVVDGRYLSHWRVDEQQLERTLARGGRSRLRDFVHRFTKS